MGRECTVCAHPERDEIDEIIVTGREGYRSVSKRYGVSPAAISRHNQRHVSPALQAVVVERELDRLSSLIDRIEALISDAEGILLDAKQGKKPAMALSAIKELRALLELLGKATGELRDGPQIAINLHTSEEWLQLRTLILEALAGYPEARIAVAERLQQALPRETS